MAVPKKTLGTGINTQKAIPSKVRHPESNEKIKSGTEARYRKPRISKLKERSCWDFFEEDCNPAQKEPKDPASKADSK